MKPMPVVNSFAALLCANGATLFNAAGHAQTADAYPSRQIRMVVPYSPGSGIDTTARLIAEKLPSTLGGPILVVENRPGASGSIGTASVARSAPDGLTLMVAPTTHVITAAVRKIDYDPIDDFTPVAAFSRGSFMVVVPAASPARTLADLAQMLKASKGEMSYSSAGIVAKLNRSINELLLRPDVLQYLDQYAMEPVGGSPEQFLALNKADLLRYAAIAKVANISAE